MANLGFLCDVVRGVLQVGSCARRPENLHAIFWIHCSTSSDVSQPSISFFFRLTHFHSEKLNVLEVEVDRLLREFVRCAVGRHGEVRKPLFQRGGELERHVKTLCRCQCRSMTNGVNHGMREVTRCLPSQTSKSTFRTHRQEPAMEEGLVSRRQHKTRGGRLRQAVFRSGRF